MITDLLPALAPLKDGLLSVVALSVVVHLVFKRFEPTDLLSLGFLLGIAPAFPTLLLRGPLASTPLAICVGYLAFYAALLFSIAAYRLSPLHPLYSYPGPLINKVTNWRLVSVAASGRQHLWLRSVHEKYGPIVRLGPNVLSIVDADLLPTIIGAGGMPKGPMWDGRRISGKRGQGAAGIAKGNLVGARDHAVHAEARKTWNRAFSGAAVKRYEPIVVRRVAQLVEALSSRCVEGSKGDEKGRPTAEREDMARWVDWFSFDFMGDICFGGPFELLRDGDKHGFLKTMFDGLYLPSLTSHVPWIAGALPYLPFIPKEATGFGEFAYKQVMRRLKEGPVHDDLFYHLNDEEKIDKEAVPLPVLITNAVTAIIAGSDTTSSSLSHALYFLVAHPPCYARLRAEVDAVFPPGEGDPTDTTKLAQMDYLNAVIYETVRLYPPLATSLQRGPTPGSGGHLVGNKIWIPEGTGVYVPPYVYHRDPRYFSPAPDAFVPERWLQHKRGDASVTVNMNAFLAFSAGPANCVGKPLGLIEMRMVLAALLQTFDFSFAAGWDSREWEEGLRDYLVITRGELPLRLTKRF